MSASKTGTLYNMSDSDWVEGQVDNALDFDEASGKRYNIRYQNGAVYFVVDDNTTKTFSTATAGPDIPAVCIPSSLLSKFFI